jgi:hypothetical protein
MKRKRKLRSLTYVYVRGFEAGTLKKHSVWKRVRRTAAEPGAAGGPEAGRKRRAKHEAGGA